MASPVVTLLTPLLSEAISAQDLSIGGLIYDLAEDAIAEGSAIRWKVFDATGEEIFLQVGQTLRRDDPQEWPVGACVQLLDVIPFNVAACEQTESDDEAGDTPTVGVSGFAVGKGLKLENGVLSLDTTGVTPGEYAGLTVDECGRVTSVSEKFPLRLEVDPCCKEG